MDDALGVLWSAIIISLIIAALVAGMFLVIPLAIALAIGYGVYQYYHGPAAVAAQAEAELQALYQKALDISLTLLRQDSPTKTG